MRTTFVKSVSLMGAFLFSLQVFAAPTLSLDELRNEVLDQNIDVRLQYEKYYQAQRGVSVAFGQFLPGASIQLININATLAVLQSVVPTPSQWFGYQASKELYAAEKYTTESIKLNILKGLTVNYLNIKYHEMLMTSMKKQEAALFDLYEAARKQEEMGQVDSSVVFMAKRNLLQHRQDIYALQTLIVAEKQALMIALNRSPNEEFELGAIPAEGLESIPGSVEAGMKLAVTNSTELLSNSYQAEAARYMVSSKRWSFISFSGIGFDYSANLSIEKSKTRVIELQAEQIELKIKNQVSASYKELDILNQRINIQTHVVNAVKEVELRNKELYQGNVIPFAEYSNSQMSSIAEERTLIRLKMERRVKIVEIKRLLGLDSSLSHVDLSKYDEISIMKKEEYTRSGAIKVWLEIYAPGKTIEDIFSVTYTLNDVHYVTETLESANAFSTYLKFKVPGEYKIEAKIKLKTGSEIVRTEFVTVY
jgi:outer membrane protein TolC